MGEEVNNTKEAKNTNRLLSTALERYPEANKNNSEEAVADLKLLVKIMNSLKCRGTETFKIKNKNGELVDLTEEIKFLSSLYGLYGVKNISTFQINTLEDEFNRLREDKITEKEFTSNLPDLYGFAKSKEGILCRLHNDAAILSYYALVEKGWENPKNRSNIIIPAIMAASSLVASYINKKCPSLEVSNSLEIVYNVDKFDVICAATLIRAIMEGTCDYKCDVDMQRIMTKYAGELLKGSWEDNLKEFIGDAGESILNTYLNYKSYFVISDNINEDAKKNFIDELFSTGLTENKFKSYELKRYDFRGTLRSLNDLYHIYDGIGDIWDLTEDERKVILHLLSAAIVSNFDYGILRIADTVSLVKNFAVYDNTKKKIKEQNSKDMEKLKASNKLKVNMVKKELSKAKEQIQFHKDKNNRLTKELKNVDKESFNIMEETISLLEDEIKELKDELIIAKEANDEMSLINDSLQDTLEEMANSKDELETELIGYRLDAFDSVDKNEKISSSSRDIPIEALYNSFKDKKILLLGGNKIHARLKEKHFDNIECLDSGSVNFKIHSHQKYDLVVIYTKLVSHSIVEKVESQMRNYGVPIIRFNGAGVTSLIHSLFMYINTGDSEDIGEYKL